MLLAGGAVVALVPEAAALTVEERDARKAEREAAREARRAELEARRAEREAEREARKAEREAEKEAEETGCSCSASLSYSRPEVQWHSNVLTFIPRVDVTLRTRGETGGPDWSAQLAYNGSVSFTSADVAAPGDVSFSGSQQIAKGQCGDNRYKFSGLALPPVSFSGLTRSLFGTDDELDGIVRLTARVEGCGFDEERRMFSFTASDFGNLRVHGWRTLR
jgi:hypothetical protein